MKSKILFFLLFFNLSSAQNYTFDLVRERLPKSWVSKSEYGTIKITKDSLLIIKSNKSVKIFKINSKHRFVSVYDTFYKCEKNTSIRYVQKDSLNHHYEIQISQKGIFLKYILNKN